MSASKRYCEKKSRLAKMCVPSNESNKDGLKRQRTKTSSYGTERQEQRNTSTSTNKLLQKNEKTKRRQTEPSGASPRVREIPKSDRSRNRSNRYENQWEL